MINIANDHPPFFTILCVRRSVQGGYNRCHRNFHSVTHGLSPYSPALIFAKVEVEWSTIPSFFCLRLHSDWYAAPEWPRVVTNTVA